jgi:hypothetical protein
MTLYFSHARRLIDYSKFLNKARPKSGFFYARKKLDVHFAVWLFFISTVKTRSPSAAFFHL